MNKSKDKVKRDPIERKIFVSVIGVCEEIERIGYNGSGDSLARTISTLVSEGLLPSQQRTIYDLLSAIPTSTIDIARGCSLKSKLVSAQLSQIAYSTDLIGFKTDGRKKFWFKLR